MTLRNVWTTCKSCGGGPIPSRARDAKMALCETCYDYLSVKSEPPEQSGVMEWKITNVDYFEQDAFLIIDNEQFYFQFSMDEGPSLAAALSFIKHDTHKTDI